MTSNKHTVAVYGSLRKGFHNHVLLETAEFVGEGSTAADFKMLSLGAYPAVVLDEVAPVVLEVYEVDDGGRQALDRLEGYPDFYDRMEVQVNLDTGEQITAWMYYLHNSYGVGSYPVVRDNDWKKYCSTA